MGESQRTRKDSEPLSESPEAEWKSAATTQHAERDRSDEARFELAAIVESSEDAIIGKTLEGIVTSWNKGAERIYGYLAGDIIGQPISAIMPPEIHDELHRILEMIGRGEHVSHFETTRLRKDGQRIRVSLAVSPIKDRDGHVIGASAVARDISGRERAERRFRQAIEGAPNGMVMIDGGGKIVLVNAQIEKSFGYNRDELLDQPIEILVPERFRARHPQYRNSFISKPAPRPMGAGRDLYGLRKDGSEFPVEIGLNPVETEQGPMVLGTVVDITERKRAEERLRKSEERLQTVIENLTEGLVISDLDNNLLHWNRAALEMHGFSNAEEGLRLLPEFANIFELATLDGTVLKVDEWPLARIYRGELLRDFEVRIRRFGTDWSRIYSYGGSIVHDADDTPLAFVTITDITERKQAEEQLRESEGRLRLALEATKLGTWFLDPRTGERRWSKRCKAIFGLPPDAEVSIEAINERLHPEDKKRLNETLQRALEPEGGGELHAEYRIFGGEGGELRWVESRARVFFEGGRAVRLIGTMLDITERKQAEEKLREQARILDRAPVLIRDLDDRIIFWNTGAQLMYGWTQEEALGKTTHSLFQTEFPQPLEEIKARLYAHGNWEGELVHSRRDGAAIVVTSHWDLHRDEHGNPKAVLEVNNDITERRLAEDEVRRLNEELEQRVADRTAQLEAANRELEAFSYSVSHDLRAPLRHINGFSQALLEDYSDKLDDEGKGYLQEVRAASQEMAQLIDDVLQLARVTRTEMRREPVDLTQLAQEIIADLRKLEPAREVSVNLQEGLTADGDKRLLKIALVNLLGNAWKFTSKRERAEISFGRTEREGETVYYVRDNGAGFDMTYVNKLFGTFQRLHTGDEFEGTGIGLATVQRVVNRHGGRVWAEGAVGQGASFYFTLPNFMELKHEEQSNPTTVR